MQHRVWDTFSSSKNRSSLFEYSIIDDKIKKIIDLPEECREDFFISRDRRTLYYRFGRPFKKIEIPSGRYKGQFIWDRWHQLSEPKDSIFINFPVNYFHNFSHNHEHLISKDFWQNYDIGLYNYCDTSKTLILKAKNGYNAFKGMSRSFYIDGEFLYGNRYYVARIGAGNVHGTIIIDIENNKYDYIDRYVYCFYSITNNEPFNFEHNISETKFKERIIEVK